MIIIIITFLHGLSRLTFSGIDALPSFPGASTISSSSRFVVEGVFRESGFYLNWKLYHFVLKGVSPSTGRGGHFVCVINRIMMIKLSLYDLAFITILT